MPKPLLILGASTRAAAFSAIRAGFQPICGDMFGDADLRHYAHVLDVPHYPRELALAAAHLGSTPWIYTGALENAPSQITSVSRSHPLWGNSGTALKRCRDPWFLQQLLARHQLPNLELCRSHAPPPRDGTWLIKPYRSAAGRELGVWDADCIRRAEPHYFQRYQTGVSVSATFLSWENLASERNSWQLQPRPELLEHTELLGISCQLTGLEQLHAPPFGYCGSIVPSRIEALDHVTRMVYPSIVDTGPSVGLDIRQNLGHFGQLIAQSCGLRGLFGIDFIWDGTTAWPLEVNPRYTASMELLECSLEQPLLDWHRRVCATDSTIEVLETLKSEIQAAIHVAEQREAFFGKVIQYADRNAVAPNLEDQIPNEIRLGILPAVADIPIAGSKIETSQPVLTCLGEGPVCTSLLSELLAKSEQLWQIFGA